MQVVELKIELTDMPYKVTRTLRVPTALRLSDLHKLLQAAMPWDNSHMYDFTLGRTLRWTMPSSDDWGDTRSATNERISDVLAAMGRTKTFIYTYDMGDCWEHAITPGRPAELAPDAPAIALLAAEGACPPDDSGGAPGFEQMIAAAADPAHEYHQDMVDWLGDDFPWKTEADTPALMQRVGKVGTSMLKRL